MDEVRVVTSPITLNELRAIASERFGDMVKAVVDTSRAIVALGGELHADEEAVLLNQGSNQNDVWGINIYIDRSRESWIEFDSMINIRPSQDNRSRSVENPEIQRKIVSVVNSLIQ